MPMTVESFTGTIEPARGGGHVVALPFDGKAAFGEARAPVRGTVGGTALRTRLAVYGGTTYLGLTKAFLAEAGLALGHPALAADDAAEAHELGGELRVALDEVVVGRLDVAHDALAAGGGAGGGG